MTESIVIDQRHVHVRSGGGGRCCVQHHHVPKQSIDCDQELLRWYNPH